MNSIDNRTRLDQQVFSYRATKDGKVLITWHGKLIMTLNDEKARKLLAQIDGADEKTTQLALAKVTGNFKRGNERSTVTREGANDGTRR